VSWQKATHPQKKQPKTRTAVRTSTIHEFHNITTLETSLPSTPFISSQNTLRSMNICYLPQIIWKHWFFTHVKLLTR